MQLDTPPTTSEWPFIYLVIECNAISAPNSKGLRKYGEEKVPSTTSFDPFSLHILEIAAISLILQVGLAGVYKYTILVFSFQAFFISSTEDVSTNDT